MLSDIPSIGQNQSEGRQVIGPSRGRDTTGKPPPNQLLEWFRNVKPNLEPIKDKVGEISSAIHVSRHKLIGREKGAKIPYGEQVGDKVLGLGDVALEFDDIGKEGLRGENSLQRGRGVGDLDRGLFANRFLAFGKSYQSATR